MSDAISRAFSTRDALHYGWTKANANLKILLPIGAVAAILALLNGALTRRGAPSLLGTLIQVAQVAVSLAYMRVALDIHDGKPPDRLHVDRLLEGFFAFLLTSVLLGLIVVAGLVLLVVPGVIWGLRYGYSMFLIVDGRRDPIDALHESRRLTDGVKGELLVFALAMIGVNLLGAMALGIGLLITMPTTFLASAFVFRRLQERAAATAGRFAAPPEFHAPGAPLGTH